MNNLEELTLSIIEYEKSTNPDIQYLNTSHAKLLSQIISNYSLVPCKENYPHAQMLFLGAPTGAGKDTLVRKIKLDNPDKNFVVLNMDMFRHYHNEITNKQEYISDKDYALKTNQTSYEVYYIIQEVILKGFPGTNVMITGTLRNLAWVQDIINRYKNDLKTNYSTSLITLAVPKKESAFSIFERYLTMVNTRNSSSNIPLRYTGLDYHDDTIKQFLANILFFEKDYAQNPNNRFFDNIKVYRRNQDIFNLSEDTLIYDTNDVNSNNSSAFSHIHNIIYSEPNINHTRISHLLDITKQNSEYLKSQNLYKSILMDLKNICPQFHKSFEDISK